MTGTGGGRQPIAAADEIPAADIGVIIGGACRHGGEWHPGKEATPFLLGRIVEITKGVANIVSSTTTHGSALKWACAYAAFA